MAEYCKICGEELGPEEEFEGICENCKISRQGSDYDEDYVDPGVT